MSVDSAALTELEELYKLRLPSSYKNYILRAPDLLNTPVIASRPDLGLVKDALMLNQLEKLVELNTEFRESWPEMEFNEDGRSFPHRMFLVGDDDGDFLAINTSKFVLVRFWKYCHEYGHWRPYAISMRHFVYRISKRLVD
ncbi:MAG TPA: hypothetical protein DDW52_23090 [Planctomycetaceae bacterium]|nr:hypothetical protein [Planctomycetaceae bacterium]